MEISLRYPLKALLVAASFCAASLPGAAIAIEQGDVAPEWRALQGPPREVYFPQVHPPGREAQIDLGAALL